MYNRLFTKILDSSIWLEPDSTRIVWVTLLASMDQDGYCHFSAIENLASRARVSLAKAQRAIKCFESPDPNSENMANQGQRIERVPGGYIVLNADYYRKKFTREIEREQTRLRVEKYRKRHKVKTGQCNEMSVTEALQSVSPVSVSASSSDSVLKRKASTQDELVQYCQNRGLKETDGQWLWEKLNQNNWTNGGKPIRDWQRLINQWQLQGNIFPSQKPQRNGQVIRPDPKADRLEREWRESERKLREEGLIK